MFCAWQRYSPTLHISPHSHAHTYANADWKAIVYGDQFDSTLRVGVRNNKAATEVAEYAPIKDLLSKERLPAVPTIDAGQAAGKSVVTAATSETAPLATSTPTPADINTPIEEALSNMAEDTRAQWEAAAARLDRARAALQALAEKLDLPVENLITPDLVRRVMWAPPADASEIPATLSAAGARPWQVELTSGLLADALHPAAG